MATHEDDAIRFIRYGHTHTPLQYPLEGEGDREIIYINTGTWRSRIQKTGEPDRTPDFMEFKQMTYAVFYRKDEDIDGKEQGTLSFDMWTGTKKKYYA
jgi:predicted phosphodiesterase